MNWVLLVLFLTYGGGESYAEARAFETKQACHVAMFKYAASVPDATPERYALMTCVHRKQVLTNAPVDRNG